MAATKMEGRGPPAGKIELFSGTYFGACMIGGVIGTVPSVLKLPRNIA